MTPMRDILVRGGTIVSMDDAVGDLPAGDVLLSAGRIAAVAGHIEAPDAEVLDAAGAIVMPGFVNAHMHTWQAGVRGIAGDWTIAEYLRAMHAGLATHFRPDDIRIANHVGALTQLEAGTTTLLDWCHNNPTPDHTDAAIDGLEASGIRALFLHGSPKPDPKEGQPHFSEIPLPRHEVERLKKGRLASDDRLVTLGLAVLGPCMSVYDVCRTDFALAREFGTVASMHVTGPMLTPDGFERLADAGLLGPHVNLVHANRLADTLLDKLVDEGVTFTVTAEVEMQMGFGRPLTNRLRARGADISIGSDIESAMASDMFGVARFTLQCARLLDNLDAIEATGAGPKTITVPSVEALRWATIGGARAAGLDHRVGSLAPGKAADLIVIRSRGADLRPVHAPASSILLQAGPANVETVIVGGILRKRDGRLVAGGLDALHAELARSGERILGDFRRSWSE
jgi:cytosine/adenosine deaminase-related metal-dependent hydrolase